MKFRGALRRKLSGYKNRDSLESLSVRERKVEKLEAKADRRRARNKLKLREKKAKQTIKEGSMFGDLKNNINDIRRNYKKIKKLSPTKRKRGKRRRRIRRRVK